MNKTINKTLAEIMVSREEVGNEKKTLKLINKAISQTYKVIYKLTGKQFKND